MQSQQDVSIDDLVCEKLKAMEKPLQVSCDENYRYNVVLGVDLPGLDSDEVYDAIHRVMACKRIKVAYELHYNEDYGDLPDPKKTWYFVAEFSVTS